MKRKILFSLFLLVACFGAGGLFTSRYVTGATAELQELIAMHRVENLRRALVNDLQNVQGDLYAMHTPLAPELDAIVAHVLRLDQAAAGCRDCHHSPLVEARLDQLVAMIGTYQDALSHYITTSANAERMRRAQMEAAAIGYELLQRSEAMSRDATRHLEGLTLEVTARVQNIRAIFSITFAAALCVGAWVTWRLNRAIRAPVAELLAATRAIAGGRLGVAVAWRDGTEFEELADNFSAMSAALQDGYQQLEAANAELESEVAERRRAEDTLRLNEFRLSTMVELHRMTEEGTDAVVDFVLQRAVQLTRSETGLLGFVSSDGRGFEQKAMWFAAAATCPEQQGSNHSDLAAAGLWAEAVRRKEAVLINDYRDASASRHELPAGHVTIDRLLAVPVLEEGRVVASAVVANKAEPYADADVQQMTLLLHALWQHVRRRQLDAELVRAQKLESVGLLAGGIAHDFNNLLTGILGQVSLADCLLPGDSPVHRNLHGVEKACERARDLTQQLLTFSKGGAPVRELVPIATLVREAATFAVSGAKARCEFTFARDLQPVPADPGQLSQVISNLVINAAQAMPNGGTIRLVCEPVTLEQGEIAGLAACDYLCIEISDQGRGIAREHLGKIFDPYFTTKDGGSGLGLATSYSIARRHGGAITVESPPGLGTTFRIYLPTRDCDGETGSAAPAQPEQEPQSADLQGARVLVMDDEEAIREVVSDILGVAGCRVTTVAEGQEALATYAQARDAGDPYQVVVLDLTIPGGMGGIAVMQRLVEIDPQVRAIVSSGYSNDAGIADYTRYGFCGRIAKPFRLETFLHAVARALDRGPVAGR